ncbi:DUF4139 domain-containing protein [Thermococcus sp.]
MKRKLIAGIGSVVLIALAVFSFQGEKAMESDTTLVLYNSAKIGVVERTFDVNLERGVNNVPLDELSGLNIAEVSVRPLSDNVSLLGIFSRSSGDTYGSNIGGDVEVKLKSGDLIKGKFMGIKDGKVIIKGEGYYIITPSEIAYFKATNIGESSVYAALQAGQAGKYRISVVYRVSNMNWESRYKLYIGDSAKLYGYIIMNNPTAQTFKDAKVLLVAGDIQLMKNMPQPRALYAKAEEGADQITIGGPEKIEAFYLYRLGVVDVNAGSKMMFPYITIETPYEREYLYESWAYDREGPVYESISFTTDKVLPAGVIEIYRDTSDGALLIGERRIEHTPKGDVVRIGIGRDYDLKGTTKVLEHKTGEGYSYYRIQITLENFGNETKTVIVRHHKWGEVKNSTIEPIDETSNYVEFKVTLKPGEKKEIVFDYENHS